MKIAPYLDVRYKRKKNLYPIYIRINHRDGNKSKTKLIPVGFSVPMEMWNGKEVIKKYNQSALINAAISDKISELKNNQAESILLKKEINVDNIVHKRVSESFTDYLFDQAVKYEKMKMIHSRNKCRRMHNELKRWFGKIYLTDINDDLAEKINEKMIIEKNNPNTRSKKMRTYGEQLKLFYKSKKVFADNPFKDYKIKEVPVNKTKLLAEDIKKLEKLKLNGLYDIARDMYLFAYYCKGQRFSVVLYAKWDMVVNDRIHFYQDKGSKPVSVLIHTRLQKLLNKYKRKSILIFPLVENVPMDYEEKVRISNIYNTVINKYLKKVGNMAGIKSKLTTHTSRHTLAYQLKLQKVDIHTIKEALGVSSYSIAEKYLKSLGDEHIDIDMKKIYGK